LFSITAVNSPDVVRLGVTLLGILVPVGGGVVVGDGARVAVGEGAVVAVGAAVGLGKGLTVGDGTVLSSQPATKTDVKKMPNATAERLICCLSARGLSKW